MIYDWSTSSDPVCHHVYSLADRTCHPRGIAARFVEGQRTPTQMPPHTVRPRIGPPHAHRTMHTNRGGGYPMRARLTLPVLALSLTVLAAVPGGTLAARSGGLAATATVTPAPSPTPATTSTPHAGSTVPTAGPDVCSATIRPVRPPRRCRRRARARQRGTARSRSPLGHNAARQ